MEHSSTVELCHSVTCIENETIYLEIMIIAAMTVFKKPGQRDRKEGRMEQKDICTHNVLVRKKDRARVEGE